MSSQDQTLPKVPAARKPQVPASGVDEAVEAVGGLGGGHPPAAGSGSDAEPAKAKGIPLRSLQLLRSLPGALFWSLLFFPVVFWISTSHFMFFGFNPCLYSCR